MNNEPVAWIIDANMTDCDDNFIWNTGGYPDWQVKDWIPLYTHPAKDNYRETHEGFSTVIDVTHPAKTEDEGKVCARCGAIAFDPVITQKAKTLTDEEILKVYSEAEVWVPGRDEDKLFDFAKAILRKAQE